MVSASRRFLMKSALSPPVIAEAVRDKPTLRRANIPGLEAELSSLFMRPPEFSRSQIYHSATRGRRAWQCVRGRLNRDLPYLRTLQTRNTAYVQSPPSRPEFS